MRRLKPLERAIKTLFLRAFCLLVKKSTHRAGPLDGRRIRKILFIRPEKIGDIFVSLPLFDALKRNFPELEISVLASPRNSRLIKNDPRFDKVLLYRKNFWRDLGDLGAIRREQFDCVVDMICSDSVTALFLTHLCARGSTTVAMGKTRFRQYYNINFDHPLQHQEHIIDHTLRILGAFGLATAGADRYARPFIPDRIQSQVDRFFAETAGSASVAPKIGINLSAGAASRFWGVEKSVALIKRILADCGDWLVYIVTAPNERNLGEVMLQSFEKSVFLIPPGQNMVQVSAFLGRLDLFISPDTSL
ncbi:MAG: glycosyltransferase family 9 protein, partial [Candidatus Zixiibacteriota bacterium]